MPKRKTQRIDTLGIHTNPLTGNRMTSFINQVAESLKNGAHPVFSFSTAELAPRNRIVKGYRINVLRSGTHNHADVLRTINGHPIYCRNRGCCGRITQSMVKANKGLPLIVCSEDCKKELERFCQTSLAVLRGELDPKHYPMEYRGQCRKFATKEMALLSRKTRPKKSGVRVEDIPVRLKAA